MSEHDKLNEFLKYEALSRWGGEPGDPTAFHTDGQGTYVYRTIAIGGVKPEGERMFHAKTMFLAADSLFEELDDYLGNSRPIWRQFPQVSRDGKRFYATARVARR